jgi:predicted nucleic acid-binding protein
VEKLRNLASNQIYKKHKLTIYDATYLELALRRSLPVASREYALKTAARRCGVKAL